MKKYIAYIILILTIFIGILYFYQYGSKRNSFYADSLGYYAYLPNTFIYKNLHQIDSLPSNKNIPNDVLLNVRSVRNVFPVSKNNIVINQYTYGVAFFHLPFFVFAHLHALLTEQDANGYSDIYQHYCKAAAIFYCLLGLYFTFLILQLLFKDKNLSIIVCCLILMATNLFWFTFSQALMSHVILFFLYALLIYLTILLHNTWQKKYLIGIAFILGWITLMRPTELLALCIPVLYAIQNKEIRSAKLFFLKSNLRLVLLSILIFLIPIIPQLLYWKTYAGDWFFYSYGANSFNWSQPRIKEGLFYFANGWFAYSPIMFVALFGLLIYKKWSNIFSIAILFLPIYIYITYSWCCFNYINGFGSRPMIHIYSLMAVLLFVTLQNIFSKHNITSYFLSIVILFFCFFNIKLSIQQSKGHLFSDESTIVFITQTIFKTDLNVSDLTLLDIPNRQPNLNEVKLVKTLWQFNKTDSNQNFYTIAENEEYPNITYSTAESLQAYRNKYLKVSAYCKTTRLAFAYNQSMICIETKRNNKTIAWYGFKIHNKVGMLDTLGKTVEPIQIFNNKTEQWGLVYFFVPIRKNILAGDELKLFLWNVNKNKMYIRDMKLEIWEKF